MRIACVCTGNTCRSPMAAALLEQALRELGQTSPNLRDIEVRSFGLQAFGSMPASGHAQNVISEMGLDLSGHKSQPPDADLLSSHLILAMTQSHKQQVLARKADARVYTLAEYAQDGADIEDPYGGDLALYRHTAQRLRELTLRVAQRLAREHF